MKTRVCTVAVRFLGLHASAKEPLRPNFLLIR